MPRMHAGPLTHVQKVLDVTLIHDDVHGHLPLEASIQQVLEDVHISEHVHDHSYHLTAEGRTGRQAAQRWGQGCASFLQPQV